MASKPTDCGTCGKTGDKLKGLLAGGWWECSHIECPKRRSAPVLDHHQTQQHHGGYVDTPHEHASGCYRVSPTTED